MNIEGIVIGEDDFGIYLETSSFDEYDELEDVLIEQFNLEPIGSKFDIYANGSGYRIWFKKSIGQRRLQAIVNAL